MILRRSLIFAGILLILFLGMYSWNYRTRMLDDLSTAVGLELSGAVLRPIRALQDTASALWGRYFDLVDVRRENEELKARIAALEMQALSHAENLAELKRLRTLVQLPVDASWRPLGARVLSGQMGPNAVLDSITINRGYATGGRPRTPLVTNMGLIGRVLKASAHTASVLLITAPGSRIAVFTQGSRARGILTGQGTGKNLEVDFVQRDATVNQGDVLITSGMDGVYPKGIPVARVLSVAPSDYTEFLAITAEPLADLLHLEEVLLLEPTGLPPKLEESDEPPSIFVGPPKPGVMVSP